MIKEDTYISPNYDISDVGRVLSAFSALDESVQRELSVEAKNQIFAKLAIKLSSFCTLHGLETPNQFLNKIFETSGAEIFDVVNSFLEIGRYDPSLEVPRELQQEILHFSRIVDLESLDTPHGTKRIRNSIYVEDYLKVFSELVTVMRSRLIQRGKNLDKPLAIGTKNHTEEVHPGVFVNSLANSLSNYLIVIKAERRRDAKDLNYQFTCLLSYLTPLEAFYGLVNYIIEEDFNRSISIFIVYNSSNNEQPILLSWSNEFDALYDDYKTFCVANLPKQLSFTDQKHYEHKIEEDISLIIEHNASGSFTAAIKKHDNGAVEESSRVVLTKFSDQNFSSAYFINTAKQVLNDGLLGVNISSIEAGHIHLDRNIDIDQQIGFEIGKVSYEFLSEKQNTPPRMHPMIDDDHVIILLKPKEYEDYMQKMMPGIKYSLVPESSPIIRAIVVELYHRIISSDKRNLMKNIGDNLYISVDDNTTCEIFEDMNGRCDSGCVIFEVALLIYRSNAEIFENYFINKFNMTDIHSRILDVWNKDSLHDEKYHELEEFKKLFEEYTNPKIRNKDIQSMINELFNNKSYGQLNVLEDYYEHQQSKVRKMIKILELPINLYSLTFNTQTGRVALLK